MVLSYHPRKQVHRYLFFKMVEYFHMTLMQQKRAAKATLIICLPMSGFYFYRTSITSDTSSRFATYSGKSLPLYAVSDMVTSTRTDS